MNASPARSALLIAMVGALVARAAGADVSVVDATAAFPRGPYTALAVDAAEPRRVGVGTADGVVAWSDDGGATSRATRILAPRTYVSAPLRSQPASIQLVDQRPSGRTAISGLHGEAPGTRWFLWLLKEGLPVVRWQYWLSVEDPETDVRDLALAPAGGLALAAAPTGLLAADRRGDDWVRVAGFAGPRGGRVVAFAVTVDPADPSHALAGTSRGTLVSHDGGRTFTPIADAELADAEVRRFAWDPGAPGHVLALTAASVYQSRDGGSSFERAFGSRDGVRAVAVADEGAYVATGRGLIVPGGGARRFPDEAVVGVVPVGGGAFLAATEAALYFVDRDGATRVLARQAFQRLEGGPRGAWALTRDTVIRVVADPPAPQPRLPDPPRIALSASAVERVVAERIGLADPTRTRLGKPWTAYLVPQLTVDLRGAVGHDHGATFDALLPFPERLRSSGSTSSCCGTPPGAASEALVLFTWDLSGLLSPRTPTYPYGVIEMNIRQTRERVLPEVRARYAEAARLAALLARPPEDALLAFTWRNLLAEDAAYLEALCGFPVVRLGTTEPF